MASASESCLRGQAGPDCEHARYERRPLGHFVALLGVLLALLAAFAATDWDWGALTDAARRGEAATRIGAWLAAFARPDLSPDFVHHAWELTLQTLSAAILGTALAVLLAWPLAMGASRAVCVGEARGAAGGSVFARLWRSLPLRSPSALLCAACRLVQDILRAVPDFVWAIILVALIGLGPLTGALALALNITGILAKVYSELWDSVDESRYAQVRSLGGGRLATFLYGIRPLASRNVLSFTLMRAECAIRNAAVIGAVGGGGLGSEIWYQVRFGAWDKVGTLILFTLLLTLAADLVSNTIRRQLRGDASRSGSASCAVVSSVDAAGEGAPTPVAALRQDTLLGAGVASPGAGPPLSPWFAAGLVALVLVWSLWFMGWGNRAGDDGLARNHLAPAAELLSGEAWSKLRFFERLLQPELDLAAIGRGDPAKAAARASEGKAVELFATHGPLDFWRPAAWLAWQQELQKWFVWRVVESTAIPLAIAVVGTVLGVGAAILLTYPHSASFQRHAARFSGETPAPGQRALRMLQLVAARATAVVARGVPEVMWAFLCIAFFGPGLVAGTLAIALHTLGVLTRVFGEAVDNLPLRRFEPTCGASRAATYGVVAVPLVWRDWMTYSFFQFESNVRAAVVLGLIGVGGLGFQFSFNFEWFRFERAGTYLVMIVLLTVLIDRGSRRLKLSRVGR
ncbi:PhnE/PtxC family ABC transporter permease [Thauera sp.]|jgi:phosphonate transport system permease protein|uniref:PhnE/PtxC family ABC transporter permease n=1 Tax=Thauera sp. TaxID=1905334 RepID=UPI002A35984F|nr:ABC transporter permease subunit [Thauera sp.]MDX9886191.1 ABC transporter permease subunit [Thauera sp.]